MIERLNKPEHYRLCSKAHPCKMFPADHEVVCKDIRSKDATPFPEKLCNELVDFVEQCCSERRLQ